MEEVGMEELVARVSLRSSFGSAQNTGQTIRENGAASINYASVSRTAWITICPARRIRVAALIASEHGCQSHSAQIAVTLAIFGPDARRAKGVLVTANKRRVPLA